jgi:hypothetical protein
MLTRTLLLWLFALSSQLSAFNDADPHWPYSTTCRIRKPADHSGGSGTLIAKSGTHALVVTNHHVVGTSGHVKVGWPMGPVEADGEVLAGSRRVDLAIIVCEAPTSIEPAIVAPFDRADGPFTACGFPSYSRNVLQVQQGNVEEIWDQTIVLDCEHKPGMSGGTVFNTNGELCAVIWGHNQWQRTGMSVPADYLLEFLAPHVDGAQPVREKLLPLSPLPEHQLCQFGRRRNSGPPPQMQSPQWFPSPPPYALSPSPDCPDGSCWRKKKEHPPQERRPFLQRNQPTEPYDPKTAPKFKLPQWPSAPSPPPSAPPSTPSAPPSDEPTTPDSEQVTQPNAAPAPELQPSALAAQMQQIEVTLNKQQTSHAQELAALEKHLSEANARLEKLLARPLPEPKTIVVPGEPKIIEVPKIVTVPGETQIVEVPGPPIPTPAPTIPAVPTKPAPDPLANVHSPRSTVYYEIRRTK